MVLVTPQRARRDGAHQRHLVVGEQDRPGRRPGGIYLIDVDNETVEEVVSTQGSRTCMAGAAMGICSRTRGSPAAGSMRSSRPTRSRSVAAGRWCPGNEVPPIRELGGLQTASGSRRSSSNSMRDTDPMLWTAAAWERTKRPSLRAPTTERSTASATPPGSPGPLTAARIAYRASIQHAPLIPRARRAAHRFGQPAPDRTS